MPISKRVNTLITALSITISITISLTLGLTTLSVQASDGVSAETKIRDVEMRQHAFSQIETQQKQINKALGKSSPDWQQLEILSADLIANSATLQHLFVPGSQSGSKAKDKVWDNNIKFKSTLAKMDNSFISMDHAIQQQDKSIAKNALKQANNTCKNCHRQYRSRW